jgi:hypothetical protein
MHLSRDAEEDGYIRSIVNETLAECHSVTLEKINWLLEMEAAATFTLNEHYFADYRQKFLQSYRNARAEENADDDEDLRPEELIARDRFEPALQIMASVRGYFQGEPTNTPRYQTAHDLYSLLQAVHGYGPHDYRPGATSGLDWNRGIRTALIEGLEVTGSDSFERSRQFLQEPPDVQSRREDLSKRRDRLRLAKRELQALF